MYMVAQTWFLDFGPFLISCAWSCWWYRPVYPYGFAVIPTDSDLKFRCYAGWVRNYDHCPIFPFPHFKLEQNHRHKIETVEGPKPSHDRKLLPLEYWLRMLIVKTLLLLPSLKWALGRWVKDVLKIRDWLPPSPLLPPPNFFFLRRSNVMRGGHVYCVCEKAIRSFTSTWSAHMVETIARGTWTPFFFFPWMPTIMLMIILAL